MSKVIYDGYSRLLAEHDAEPVNEPTVRDGNDPVPTGTATATGGGWYALEPSHEGDEKVQGRDNVPEGYTITEG